MACCQPGQNNRREGVEPLYFVVITGTAQGSLKNPGEVKSPHPVEKTLELGMVPKQLTSCLHEQVRLVPR